ncbi:MAG: insulinase family protein [Phycisphaerae bacterium]|nr:insulinase family protein [Phycisphaerae bacterium]
MKRIKFNIIILFSVLASIAFGQANKVKTQIPAASDKLFDYQQITLDNGLQVITLEDFSCPIVAVQVWYNVGSKDEKPDRQGYAHMFEHMMFKGTDLVSEKDQFNLVRKVGGRCNAYTSFDRTVYHETLPANQIELALWLEAERMSFLKIDQEAFDTERKVVEEELRMGENQPYGNVFKKMARELFTVHPYHWTPIGNIAHLRATSVPDLREFWTERYVPNNAVLIVVGAVEHQKAQSLAKQYFGWIPAEPQPKRVTIKEPPLKNVKKVVIDDENAPAGQVMLGWRTVPAGTRDETVLDCLSQILGDGHSSRIYRALVADTQLAVEAGTWTYNLQQDGIFIAEATLAPTADNYDVLLEALETQVETIQKDGVTDAELEKAKNQLLKALVTTNLQVESKAILLGNAAVTIGEVSKVNTMLDEIRSVTKKDIQRAAKKYLSTSRVIQFTVLQNQGMQNTCKDNEDAPITAEPELESPAPGRPCVKRPVDYPTLPPLANQDTINFKFDYNEEQLENSLTVLVVPNHEVPFVSVILGLTNGAWTETKPGTAFMTLSMLTKGTDKHNEAQLSEELEQYAISLNSDATLDTGTVSMNCLKEQLDRGMGFLSEVVLEPTFDTTEFEKLLSQQLTELKIKEQEPRYLADKYFNKELFGHHPYSRMVESSTDELAELTPTDLKQWWSKFARPDQAALIFAGDIEKVRAVELAKRHFGQWKANTDKPTVTPADIPNADATKIYLVNRPGSAQAQIKVGQFGLTRRQQPDYFIGMIASNYFGGSFHSRLNENLRVKRGLTYGAWGYFRPRTRAGTFEISTFTKNESVAETISVILEQIHEFQTVEPTDSEFYDTRSYIVGSFAQNRETPQDVAGDLWMLESQQLDRDYFDKFFSALNKMTKQDCVNLAKKFIHPEKLTVVVVGDAEKLKESLETIAPVQVLQLDGKDES